MAPPIGAEPCLGPAWPKARQILRDREVAGHADLPPAADAHAVDAADHRFVAGEDGADHVVEQAHVLAVLLRLAGVVLGVLLGVAAGAEGLVAGAGEDHAVDGAVVARRAHGQDHALDHVGGVAVELARVVQRDPGVEQARHHIAVGPFGGAPLVGTPARLMSSTMSWFLNSGALTACVSSVGFGSVGVQGTITARRVISRACTAEDLVDALQRVRLDEGREAHGAVEHQVERRG